MGGDDAGRVTEVNVSEGAQGTRSAYKGIRANGRCRVAQRSDRLSVEDLAPQTVSRPAFALIRRRLGVSEAVADIAVVKQSGGAPHIGLGWGQRRRRIIENCRGCGMLPASSSMGGKNVSVSMAPVRIFVPTRAEASLLDYAECSRKCTA